MYPTARPPPRPTVCQGVLHHDVGVGRGQPLPRSIASAFHRLGSGQRRTKCPPRVSRILSVLFGSSGFSAKFTQPADCLIGAHGIAPGPRSPCLGKESFLAYFYGLGIIRQRITEHEQQKGIPFHQKLFLSRVGNENDPHPRHALYGLGHGLLVLQAGL